MYIFHSQELPRHCVLVQQLWPPDPERNHEAGLQETGLYTTRQLLIPSLEEKLLMLVLQSLFKFFRYILIMYDFVFSQVSFLDWVFRVTCPHYP